METLSISVTEASRNFSDCVNRARYQGASFLLLKGHVPVAQIVPVASKPVKGGELALALETGIVEAHLDEKEATAWLHDLEQSRRSMQHSSRP